MTKESQNTEFKQSWHDDYLKWICGFANLQGGRLFLGKDEAGNVFGLPKAKKLFEDLPSNIRDQLGLMPYINLLHENSRSYLEIIIEPSTVPISLRCSYNWRSGSVKQELKGHALTEFLLKTMGISWDQVIQERATLYDIEHENVELLKPRVSEELGNQLGSTKERILLEMKTNQKVSGTQLADLLDISTAAVEKHIKQLREEGLIVRVDGTRGHWVVKE